MFRAVGALQANVWLRHALAWWKACASVTLIVNQRLGVTPIARAVRNPWAPLLMAALVLATSLSGVPAVALDLPSLRSGGPP